MPPITEVARPVGFLDRFLPGEGRDGAPGPRFRIGDMIAILHRQRRVLIPLVLLGPIAGAIVSMLTPPVYDGTVSVKIDNDSAKIIEGQNLDPVIAASDTGRYLATQAKLVASRTLATAVLDSLGLARNDSFIVRTGARPKGEDLPPQQRQMARREQIVALLQDNVTMVAPTDSRIATISFRSRDRLLAARVANAYGDKYVNQNVLQHVETNVYARKVLADQVAESRRLLQEQDQQAIAYARANRLIDTGDAATGNDDSKAGGGSHSVTTANLVGINAAFIGARSDRIAAEQRWVVAQQSQSLDIPESRDNGALQSLIQQRAIVAAKLAQLRKRYGGQQPDVEETAAQLATLQGQIGMVAHSIRESIRNEYKAAARRESELGKARDQLAGETLSEQEKRVQFNLITRNAETQRQQLADLLTRFNQVTAAAGVNTNNISIIDRAEVPEKPTLPNTTRNVLLGLLAGIILAAGVALVRELMDDTLHTPEDVESKLRLSFLGATPRIDGNLIDDLGNPKSTIVEAYYSIRAAVDYASGGPVTKVLMITSGAPQEAKSTSSFALAQDFARTGRRVLLIDADMRRPTQHHILGIPRNHKGLTEVLMHEATLHEAVVKVDGTNLEVLLLGTRPANPVHLLSSTLLDEFFAQLRKRYDVIVVDSAPVMGLADAPLLARVADGVVFVVEAGRAHNGLAKVALRRLTDNGAKMLGVIMTKLDAQQNRYGYGYSSYYYYNHAYTYGDEPTQPIVPEETRARA